LGFSYVLKGVDEVFLPSRDISPSVFSFFLKGVKSMLVGLLWAVVVVLVVLWLLGFLVVHVGGGLIHLLLIVAVIILLYNLFVAMRSRA
jgi:hypothetical protein